MGGTIKRILAFLGFTLATFVVCLFIAAIVMGVRGAESDARSKQLALMFGLWAVGAIPTVIYHCMSCFFTEDISDFFGWAVDAYFYDLKGDPRRENRRILFPAKISRKSEGKEFERGAPYREYLAGTLGRFSFETAEDASATIGKAAAAQTEDMGNVRRFFANVRIVFLNALRVILIVAKLFVFLLVLLAPLLLFGGAGSLGAMVVLNKDIIGLYWLIPFFCMLAGLGGVIATSFVCDWEWFQD